MDELKKGDIYEAVIEKYDFPNKGSLTMDGRKVVIKGALPGQRVKFMVTKKKSGMAEGRVLEVLERAPIEDASVTCSYFGECGGCAYRTMTYENQLKLKEDMVKKLLDNVLLADDSASKDYKWEGILPSPVVAGYRNKMEFTFGDAYKDGPLALGLHKKGSFHDILNVAGCEIIGADWSKILTFTENFFAAKEVPYYHRMKHEGILRNLVVRQSKATGEFLINLVTTTQWDKYGFDNSVLDEFTEGLLKLADSEDFEGTIAGILYTENDTLGDVVKSDRMLCLYGKDFIMEEVMGLKFKISPFSFFQTNTKGCEVLYSKAREYILSGDVDGKVVFDLYSGTGTIAQMMAPVAKKVIGIEIVEEAVVAARENAKLNGLDNCEFIAGDVLKSIDLVQDKPDLIVLDPPRDGINPKALDKILAFGVDEMVYISCKPTSLARDLEIITERGYRVVCGACVDQFPWTNHVETVCLLSKLHEAKHHVNVRLDMDELDITSAESKATYEEIKKYVAEHYDGMKVSNLYIAQVKAKYGIIERENYNKAKSDDARQPKCPKEKENAIVEALRYFQMIPSGS